MNFHFSVNKPGFHRDRLICIFLFTYLSCYGFFFTSIISLYLVYLFIFHHSRTLLVLILISGDDLNKL